MQMLNQKMANDIVRETSVRLHRNVNIMNTEGRIIAALDKSRIGAVHEGARQVLATGQSLAIAEGQEWEGAQPGVNLPIVFMDELIGVIGITGAPEELEDIGELVKMTTELMIRQAFLDSQMEWQQRTKEMIIDQLLRKDPSIATVEENLALLDLHLEPPFTSVIVQFTERATANRILIQQVEKAIGNGIASFINVNRLVVILSGGEDDAVAGQVQALHTLLKKLAIQFRMSYSLPYQHLRKFSQSYKDCEITLEISGSGKELTSFAYIELKSLFYQVDETVAERFAHRVLKNLDKTKAETLESFFAHNLNIQKTADDLFLHRNTLIYRLKKIVDDTGYDPKNFKDALILQAALWIFQKWERKSGS